MKVLIYTDEDFKRFTSYLDTTDIKWLQGQKPSAFNPLSSPEHLAATYPYQINMEKSARRSYIYLSKSISISVNAIGIDEYFKSVGYVEKAPYEPVVKEGMKIIINNDKEFQRIAESLDKQGVVWNNNKPVSKYNPVNSFLRYPFYISIRIYTSLRGDNSLRLLAGNYNSDIEKTGDFITVNQYFTGEQEEVNEVTAEYKDGIITISDVEYDMVVSKELIIDLYKQINA